MRPARPKDPAAFLRELRRRDFGAFLQRAWPHIHGGELLEWNWHFDAMAWNLDRVRLGPSKRLIVNVPPRNGKSNTISVIWVAWMLGCNPRLNFVCVSYANELSGKPARDCLSIMQSDWYRDVFPRTIISAKRSKALDFETTSGGGRLSTSVSGTLTGRGGDIIILDDVIKPQDANSEVVRTAVNEWFKSTLSSRLNDKRSGAILCVMQRLHQYDLPGMLLESGQWDHLSLPAIAPEEVIINLGKGRTLLRKVGDVLHPERESFHALTEQKRLMGSLLFEAQFQQNPQPAEGNVIKAVWLRTCAQIPSTGGEIIQSWDTGIKSGQQHDPSVCITARLIGRELFIIDVWRGRVEFPDLKRQAMELARHFRAGTILIEDKGSGQELLPLLRAEPDFGPALIARIPTQDKLTRLHGVSSLIKAGQLFLPMEAGWLPEFRSEILAFPNGRFDDQVDALSQLLDWVRSRWTITATPNAGPVLMTEGDSNISEGDWLTDLDKYLDAWI